MKQLADKMTTDFPIAPAAYGLNGPSAAVTVEKSILASHTEILTSPIRQIQRIKAQKALLSKFLANNYQKHHTLYV